MALFNIWLTERCNMNCTYCYENNKSAKLMSNETINDLIAFISEKYLLMDYPMINFHGGEPLIAYEQMISIIDNCIANKMNFKYSVTTNALLLNESMVRSLREFDVYLSVSLDGNRDVHDRCRKKSDGTGTYEEVIKKIQIIKMKFHIKYKNQSESQMWQERQAQ